MGLEVDPEVASYMARSNGSGALAVLPTPEDSLAFIEGNSPQQGDILPGLCLFVQLWLMQVSSTCSSRTLTHVLELAAVHACGWCSRTCRQYVATCSCTCCVITWPATCSSPIPYPRPARAAYSTHIS